VPESGDAIGYHGPRVSRPSFTSLRRRFGRPAAALTAAGLFLALLAGLPAWHRASAAPPAARASSSPPMALPAGIAAAVAPFGTAQAIEPGALPPLPLSLPGSPPGTRAVAQAMAARAGPVRRLTVEIVRLGRNQTIAQALYGLALDAAEVQAVVKVLGNVFSFRHARPGDQIRIERLEGQGGIQRITYRQGPAQEWMVQRAPDGQLAAEKRPVKLETEVARVDVTLGSSLYDTLQKAGEDPSLAVAAADVLAWDVDFYRDIQRGDRMKMLVEKVYADGKLLRYGEILAAEYVGSTVGRKRLFRYTDPTGQASYYDEQGNSARRGFLKSPLKYAHVTSGFGMRFHPVLQYMRAHQGVDYGAPTGTPVWAVSDGMVKTAGWQGGCGKAVTLHHRNGLDTVYCHLSAIAVRAGTHVTQKQVIGAVGQTGLASGPHLHFAVKRDGAFLNPLGIKLPREAPLPNEYRADFKKKTAPLVQRLEAQPVA
jgi:murein DD-endopeptidase MepM/ murein hydrolase activator NlpD